MRYLSYQAEDPDLRHTLDLVVAGSIGPALLVVSLLLLALSASHWLLWSASKALPMSLISLAAAAVFLVLRLVIRNREIPANLAHPFAMLLLLVVIGVATSEALISRDPLTSADLALVMVIAGALILARPWYWLALGVVASSIAGLAIFAGTMHDARLIAVLGLEAAVIFVLIHVVRVTAVRQMLASRRRDEERAALLARTASELRETEAARQESDSRYSQTASLTSDYIYSVTLVPDGSMMLDWATELSQLTDYSAAELREHGGWPSIVFTEDLPVWNARRQRIGSGAIDVSEYRIVTRSGMVKWIRDYARPRVDAATGRVVGYVGATKDVTEQRAAEDALRASEQRNREQKRLFENLYRVAQATTRLSDLDETLRQALQVAVSITDADNGSLMLLDPEMRVIQSIIARPWDDGRRLESAADGIITSGLGGWVARNRLPVLVEDTSEDARWFRPDNHTAGVRAALAAPILDEGRALGVITLVHGRVGHFTPADLQLMIGAGAQLSLALRNAMMYEAQVQLTQELSQAKEAAESASRAKSAFLSTMGHELRTPLTVILGYGETLADWLPANAPEIATRALDHVRKSAAQLLSLINDVLEYSGLEAQTPELQIEEFSVREFADETTKAVAPLARQSGNSIQTEIDEDLGTISADRGRLRRVLLRLLNNAAKFTANGVIRLAICPVGDKQPAISFTVADTGIGIAAEQQRRMFEPFVQADTSLTRKHGGSGLGLAICRRLCEQMGGEISVSTELGKGSSFTVTIPCPLHRVHPALSPVR